MSALVTPIPTAECEPDCRATFSHERARANAGDGLFGLSDGYLADVIGTEVDQPENDSYVDDEDDWPSPVFKQALSYAARANRP